jgi:gliding motility-associated-like protein
MKSCSLYKTKIAVTLTALLLFQELFSQNNSEWGLNITGFANHQWASTGHYLIIKAKYTSQNQKSVLYNFTPFYNNGLQLPDNNKFGAEDYKNWFGSKTMVILKDTSSRPIFQDDYEYEIGVQGSSSNYAKDFETDENDNFIILADNKGNGWDPENPVSSAEKDSTQILLCKLTKANRWDKLIHWHKIYGGSSAEYAVAIRKTVDGNFIVLAQTQSNDGDVVGYHGGKDIWLLKINSSNGSIIWKKTIGTPADEIPTDLEILNDGSIVISGTASPSSLFPSAHTGLNSFLLKLDQNGSVLWSKVFGGNGSDKIYAFVPITDGGFVSISASNSLDGDYPVNNGGYDSYIARHDVNGDIIWNKHYGSTTDDIPGDIAFTKCDSMIYTSFSKNFRGSGGEYPAYSRHVGVRVRLRIDGTESNYFQEAFYFSHASDLSSFLTPSIVANTKGGILSANMTHSAILNVISRSFSVSEYGFAIKRNSLDTFICKGQQAWGRTFYTDTTFTDTLRNYCQIDTLINKYAVYIINGDSTISKDTTVCYGKKYKDLPVYHSFAKKDTTTANTTCGLKLVIISTNVKVTPPIINPFGRDSIICKNQRVDLNAFSPALHYLWQDGSSSATYATSDPGLYWVEVTDMFGCKSRDSIVVRVAHDKPLQRNVLDTLICKGQQVWGKVFYKDSTFSDTLRNNCQIDTLIKTYIVRVANTDSLVTKDTIICYGTFYKTSHVYNSFIDQDTIKVTNSCGVKMIVTTTNVKVTSPIINSFGEDTVLCKNQSIVLNAYSPAANYLWQDGSLSSSFSASNPGLYWVEVTDTSGCTSRDSMVVRPSDLYLVTFPDTTISFPSSVVLSPSTNGTLIWDNDPTLSCTLCPSPKASPSNTTIYRLSSKRDNCILNNQIKVIVNNNFYLHIPSSFTPNNDNLNDYFKVSTNLNGPFTLAIYNRNGEKIFVTNNPSRGWNGTYKGIEQPTGNYVYTISYQHLNTGLKFMKGNVVLIK